MRTRRLIGLALRSIRRNLVRSALTMLGVVIGVGSVVVMVAIGQGARAEIQARVDSLGTNLVVVTPGSSNRGGVSGGAGSLNRLTVDDAEHIAREASHVAMVSPVVMTRSTIIGEGGNWRTFIYGVAAEYESIRSWTVSDGRFFDPDEVRTRRKVCLLGSTVAEATFPGGDPVGKTIRLRDVPFEIIGVLGTKGQTAEGTDQDDVVLAPYTTIQTRLSGWSFIGQVLASAWSDREVAEAVDEIRVLMREAHELGPREDDDFEVRDQRQLAETAQGTTEVMTMLLAAVASVSLVVGGIGIMNIMLVSVRERTVEIGLRRALGARRRDVLAQFLVESVVLSALGGLIGSAVGVGASAVLGAVTGWAVSVTPASVGLAIGFSAGVGIFFGWFPALQASRLDPIEALRHS